jgi:EAL domain-containing protein (putative c-di-GMP-specific phosphodiesterase class I)
MAPVLTSLFAGHDWPLAVLAEGVETKEQLDFLARETCDEMQDYLIGKPLPIENYAGTVGRSLGAAALAAAG